MSAPTHLCHELRTPLTSLCAALGLLRSGKVSPESERGQRLLSIAANSTQRLLRVTVALEADSAFSTLAQAIDLERLRLESDLYAAWENQEFTVFYQPIVCTRTQRIVSLEALMRWQHPQRGLVSPAVFVPLAEELGLISALSEWVLEQACRQLRYWQERFAAAMPLAISVNLSPLQLGQPDLVERVSDTIQRTGIAPGSLHLEITESALIENSEVAIAVLRQFKSLGIPIYLDDFGTGYSSLSRLHELSVDVLKVDRSFVVEEQWALIRGIRHLAVGLGLEVIVEGIETAAELERVQHLGCDRCQGYCFSKPVDAAEATLLLQEYNCPSASQLAAKVG